MKNALSRRLQTVIAQEKYNGSILNQSEESLKVIQQHKFMLSEILTNYYSFLSNYQQEIFDQIQQRNNLLE